jgi:hypothetical protein
MLQLIGTKELKTLYALPYFRWLVVGPTLRRPGFKHRSFHAGFVVEKAALRRVFLRVRRVFPDNNNPLVLHKHSFFYHRRYLHVISATDSVVYKHLSS